MCYGRRIIGVRPIGIQNRIFTSFCRSRRTDTAAEIELVCRTAEASGASAAVPCHHWGRGGRGAVELAHAVREATAQKSDFHFLYSLQVKLLCVCLFFCFVFCFLCVNSSGLKISALTQHQLIRFHGRARENVEYVARWRDFSCVVRVKRLSSRRGGV